MNKKNREKKKLYRKIEELEAEIFALKLKERLYSGFVETTKKSILGSGLFEDGFTQKE